MREFLLNGIPNLQRNAIIQSHTSIFSRVPDSLLGIGPYLPGELMNPPICYGDI